MQTTGAESRIVHRVGATGLAGQQVNPRLRDQLAEELRRGHRQLTLVGFRPGNPLSPAGDTLLPIFQIRFQLVESRYAVFVKVDGWAHDSILQQTKNPNSRARCGFQWCRATL